MDRVEGAKRRGDSQRLSCSEREAAWHEWHQHDDVVVVEPFVPSSAMQRPRSAPQGCRMHAEPALEHLESWDLIRAGLLAKSSTAAGIVVVLRVADQSKHLAEVETAGLHRAAAAAAAARCARMVVFETDDSESAVEIVDPGSELADLSKTLFAIDTADFESSPVAAGVPIAAVSEIVV